MGKRKSSQSRVARQPKIARPRQSTRLRQSSNDTTQDVLGTSTPRRAGRPKRARHSSGNPSSGRSATTSINPAPETDGPQYSGNETTGANQSSSQPPSHAQPMQGEVDVAMQSHLPEISQFSETTRHRFNNLESERESNLVVSFPSIVPNTGSLYAGFQLQITHNESDTRPRASHNLRDNEAHPPTRASSVGQSIQSGAIAWDTRGEHSGAHIYNTDQSPLFSVTDRLGTKVHHNMKEKIWRGQYVDFNTLLETQNIAI